MNKLILIIIMTALATPVMAENPYVVLGEVNDFDRDMPTVILGHSGLFCSLNGCSMRGDIDMNNNSIINAVWVNATYVNVTKFFGNYTEIDPIWESEKGNYIIIGIKNGRIDF